MAFSRRSLRRVIGEMVHRHNGKSETIDSSLVDPKHSHRSRKKSDRNSVISSGSLSVLHRAGEAQISFPSHLVPSNVLRATVSKRKRTVQIVELPGASVNPSETGDSLQSNHVVDWECLRHREHFQRHLRTWIPSIQVSSAASDARRWTSLLRTRLLRDVYALLADLIDWSDRLLLAEHKDTQPDEGYKTIAEHLIHAIRVSNRFKERSYSWTVQMCISIACDASSVQSVDRRSDSCRSFRSNTGYAERDETFFHACSLLV